MTAGHLSDRRALLQDLQHGPVPLLHHTDSTGAPGPRRDRPADRSQAPGMPEPGNQCGVSPTYRNYCQPATRTA